MLSKSLDNLTNLAAAWTTKTEQESSSAAPTASVISGPAASTSRSTATPLIPPALPTAAADENGRAYFLGVYLVCLTIVGTILGSF